MVVLIFQKKKCCLLLFICTRCIRLTKSSNILQKMIFSVSSLEDPSHLPGFWASLQADLFVRNRRSVGQATIATLA